MASLHDGASFDVAVVGFGPSGAVAAALLGQAGIKTLVIDRTREVYARPRAIALDHEIMRVFQQLGLADEIGQYCRPFTPSEYYGVDGQLIKRLATLAPPYPLGYTPSMVFTQPPVERALREHVAGLPGVTVALGQRFVSLAPDAEHATLEIQDEQGVTRRISARYVIGCDGASSSVREAVGIKLDDLEFDEPWLVIDVLVNDKGLAKLPHTSVQYCDPARPCTYVIGPDNHRRWEISLLPGEDPAWMATPEGAWNMLRRWIGPEDGELWRQASYRFHALVAREWRQGRVFIAGDAAHQQPPFLGQGMCQGVRDVVNLCWKLRAVLGGSADRLLDTYGPERGAHVRRLTGRIKDIGRIICERDVDAARARDARLLDEAGGTIKTVARQDIIPALETGLLASPGQGATGTLFPQPRVLDGEREVLLDELAGTGWRVVTSMRLEAIAPELRAQVAAVGTLVCLPPDTSRTVHSDGAIETVETEGVMAKWFERHGCIAAVVRPDHYVYVAARDAAELERLLTDLAIVGIAF